MCDTESASLYRSYHQLAEFEVFNLREIGSTLIQRHKASTCLPLWVLKTSFEFFSTFSSL